MCPDGVPRTKPRACNYGLEQATGELCVIYDAEDRPEYDQLRLAADAFHAAPADVVCLQAPLDYHNHDHNLLTRFFTVEYNFWFDLLLPGLVRSAFPVPLGGTSNHLRVAELRALGGWDPYNVTEDADLGMRLHAAGGRTRMLASVTLEEACSRLRPWIRQRTRWQKGYLQTWAAPQPRTAAFAARGGLRAAACLHLLVGGCVVVNLLNPPLWGLTIYFAITRADWVLALFPGFLLYPAVLSLVIGNFFFLYVNFLAVLHRERWHLVHAVVLMPLYWLLMSVAAWRALGQLVTSLHVWEKTPHGLSGGDTDPARPPVVPGVAAPEPAAARAWRRDGSVRREHSQRRIRRPDLVAGEARAAVGGVSPVPGEHARNAGLELRRELALKQVRAIEQRPDRRRLDAQLAHEQGLAELVALGQARRQAVPLVAGHRDQRVVVVLAQVDVRHAVQVLVGAARRAALTGSDRAQAEQVVAVDRLHQRRHVGGERLQRGRRGGRARAAVGRLGLGLVDELPRQDRGIVLVARDDLGDPLPEGGGHAGARGVVL